MAERKISTRLAIEGESEFKTALQNCNAAIKTMRSELALVQSEYQGNANHMTALTAKGDALNRMYEAQKTKVDTLRAALENAKNARTAHASAVEQYKTKLAAAEQALKRLGSSTEDTGEEQARLGEEIQKLGEALSVSETKEKAAAKGIQDWQQKLNYAQKDQNELAEAVRRNNQYMQEASESADGYAVSIDRFGKEIKQAATTVEGASDSTSKMKTSVAEVADALAAMSVADKVMDIARGFKACADAAIEFESSMTGVFKTVDGTDAQMETITNGIKQMSTEIPATTKEIASVAEVAGQLGVRTDDVLGFTRTMIDLGESTNLSAEEAASAFAKFANITGTAAADYERLGSVTVALGNNLATTEADIVAMATRLASAGTLAGLTETEIMALAAAMSSVGIEADAGGTAMTQTLTAIESAVAKGGEELAQFARVAGVSAAEFSALWGTNAMSAVQKFIAGLGALGKKGESATLVLEEMGLSGVRQSNMLKGLALTSDELAGAIDLSNSAWAANTALSDEAGKRYETTESRVAMCGNAFENLKASIGDALLPMLGNLAEGATDAFAWAEDFVVEHPELVQALAAVAAGMGGLVAAFTGLQVVQALKPAVLEFNAILGANPAIAIATAVLALGSAFVTLKLTMDDDSKSLSDMTEASRGAKDAIGESGKAIDAAKESASASADVAAGYVSRLKELETQGLKTKEAQSEYALLVEKLNTLYPELNLQINENTGKLDENTETLLGNIEAQKEAALAAAFREQQTELLKQQAEVEVEIATNKADLNGLQEQENALLEENNALGERNQEIGEELASLGADDIMRRAELSAELNNNNEAMYQNTEAAVQLRGEQDVLNEAIAEGTEISAALSGELDRIVEAQHSAAGSAADTADGLEGLTDEQKNAVQAADDAYDAYVTLYDNTKTAALDSIGSQISQWEKMDNKAVTSAATVQEALQSQITYMQNYSSNMQSLQSRNIEGVDKLAAALSDGSAESAAILAGLSGATDDEIRQIIASMGDVEQGKEAMANAMAGADTAVKAAMDKAVEAADRRDSMLRSGTNSADGLISGLNTAISRAATSGSRAALAYMNAYNSAMIIQSPSKKMFKSGSDTVQGLINAYKSREDELKEQGKRAAEILQEAYGDNDEAKEKVKSFLDFYEESIENTADNAEAFGKVIKGQLDELEDAWDEAAKKQEKMAEKLSGYGDLFTEKDGRYTVENLDEQINTLNRYEEVLSKLRDEKGISQGLLDEMVGMGIDDAIGYGEKLLAMGDTQFDEYNAKWEAKQQRAKEIPEEFYRNEFDALKTQYTDVLENGVEDLKNIGFGSGEGFMQYLYDGMVSQEDEIMTKASEIARQVKSTIDAALDFGGSSSKKNGSHALGIDYVPFDGYIAELHKGERVLTASETQAYIDANTPSSFDIPAERQLAEQQTAALVNAIGTLTAGAGGNPESDSAIIILQTGEGMEIARWLLPSIREASAQSPEVERDF